MNAERELIDKLLRIEALFAGATTDGEKAAAASAAERIRSRLRETTPSDPAVEYRFSVADNWSRKLLLALLRRYQIQPYRYQSQRRTTIMARVSRRFVDQTLWPEFLQFDRTLQAYLNDVTERVISEAVCANTQDEEIRPDEPEARSGERPRELGSSLKGPGI